MSGPRVGELPPPCTDPHHISEDRPTCACPEDEAWDYYLATGIYLCAPCRDTDCHGCEGGACECAHFWISKGALT